ncbi:zinc finger protein 513 [Scomber japonicus]|uniref:zinc finger protein 513 n=1 Tax=Scomber japonicus TaxID=13676 RepID=UPI002306B981|nr:zinc finger protein 513 [Scomber japonicus]
MPRRKQSNPQPVKLDSEDGAVVYDPSCLVLDSDFLLSGELEFGDSEIMGLDRDTGLTVFSLSVEDDSAPTDSTFPAFLSCKGCGQLLGDTPLGAGLDLGVGLDLGAELYCLSCEEGLQHVASFDSSHEDGSNPADRSIGDGSGRTKEGEGEGDMAPKLYSCSLCPFTSRYSNHLKRHMRIHDGQKPYRCPVCPYASAQLVNLQRHARTHTGEKPYRCHQCSYACSSLGNLRRHQRMHTQERPQRREKEKRRGRRKKNKGDAEEVMSDLTLRVSQDSGYLQTLGGLGSPSAPLPVLLFPLCCRLCGLTLEEADLEGDKAEEEGDGDGGEGEGGGGRPEDRCDDVSNMLDGSFPARDFPSVVKQAIDDMMGREVTFDILFHNSEHQATLFRYGVKKSEQGERIYEHILPSWEKLFKHNKL